MTLFPVPRQNTWATAETQLRRLFISKDLHLLPVSSIMELLAGNFPRRHLGIWVSIPSEGSWP